ncbi:MAG: alternative ribosome rescue aminoacyl-tRNA hydrolase ArfB [Legionellaceae bacterium]|nr:alternative ribosome rescue aminoacyl-tRNA hydrolase ArfB [Legionellaceae bacterium]
MSHLKITDNLSIPISEVMCTAIRSSGAGGQHVNKVSTAIHLRFDIAASSLPDVYKTRLMYTKDYRITSEGVIVIKAQRHKNQEHNKKDALERLARFIQKAISRPKKRQKTKPSRSSVKKRVDSKVKRGQLKKLRKSLE